MRRKAKGDDWRQDPPVRPQLYLSVLLVMVIIVLIFAGQWDWALAVFIGMLLGNLLSAFTKPS